MSDKSNQASIDANTNTSVTEAQAQAALEHIELAASMFEPGGQLCGMTAESDLRAADEALGCFIRKLHGDAFYAAMDLRRPAQPQFTSWLELPLPARETGGDDSPPQTTSPYKAATRVLEDLLDDWKHDGIEMDYQDTASSCDVLITHLIELGMLRLPADKDVADAA